MNASRFNVARVLTLSALLTVGVATTPAGAFPVEANVPRGEPSSSVCTPAAGEPRSAYHGEFGSDAHERLTRASLEFAQSGTTKTVVTKDDLEKLLLKPRRSERTILACCRYTAGSRYCRCLSDGVRTRRFEDPSPIITGTRWPDDPCHMTARIDTFYIPVYWVLGGPGSGNNLFYLSHFHNFAFLHAMAASGHDEDKSHDSTEVSRQKVLTWLEFAFRVATGQIPSGASFREALLHIGEPRQKMFRIMFPGFVAQPREWTIDMFLVGIKGADSQQVRQVALGAMLHTIQDAFSDAHVKRSGRTKSGPAFPVTGVGAIEQFLDYKLQDRLRKHREGDTPPGDLLIVPADAEVLHPVRVGAELIACAAVASKITPPADSWTCAESRVAPLFALEAKHFIRSGAGRYR